METRREVFKRIERQYLRPMSAEPALKAELFQGCLSPSTGFSIKVLPLEPQAISNLPIVKVYPTGKKDGNKLGKRKRSLTRPVAVYDRYENKLWVNPDQMEEITKNFLNPKTAVITIDSGKFWSPPPPFPLRAEVSENEFNRLYMFNFDHRVLQNPTPMVKVTAV